MPPRPRIKPVYHVHGAAGHIDDTRVGAIEPAIVKFMQAEGAAAQIVIAIGARRQRRPLPRVSWLIPLTAPPLW